MTQEEIIRMAQEAGFRVTWGGEITTLFGGKYSVALTEKIERFTGLVEKAVEDRLKWNDVHTCGPTCQRPGCVNIRRSIDEAVRAEREACEKVCEEVAADMRHQSKEAYSCAYACVAAIRARGEK